MFMKSFSTLFVVFALFALQMDVDLLNAEVNAALRGKFAGVVKIRNKQANKTYTVEQSTAPGSNQYVDTGYEITTDAQGNGSVRIPNIYSGRLLTGHTIRVGTNTAVVKKVKDWFPGVAEGPQELDEIVLSQVVAPGSANALMETWNPDTIMVLQLDPNEASWFNINPQLQTDGDLQAELLELTPQEIVIRVIDDPTMISIDEIHLFGIGIDVQPGVPQLHPQLGMMGSADYFINNEHFGTEQHLQMVWMPMDPIQLQFDPVVLPQQMAIVQGQHVAGGIPELTTADNQDISIRRSGSGIQAKTGFEVAGRSPLANPDSLSFEIKGSVFARTPVNLEVSLFNFEDGQFETVSVTTASRFSDTTVLAESNGDASRFVEPGTQMMIAQICYDSISPRQQFSSNTDQVRWIVE